MPVPSIPSRLFDPGGERPSARPRSRLPPGSLLRRGRAGCRSGPPPRSGCSRAARQPGRCWDRRPEWRAPRKRSGSGATRSCPGSPWERRGRRPNRNAHELPMTPFWLRASMTESVDSPSWTVITTWRPAGPSAFASSSYQSAKARTRTSSAPATTATMRRRRRTRAERSFFVRPGWAWLARLRRAPLRRRAHPSRGRTGRTGRMGCRGPIHVAAAGSRRRCPRRGPRRGRRPGRRRPRCRSRSVQPGLEQHHGGRAVDHLTGRPSGAPGRPQVALCLDRGQSLVRRLDRDPQGLEQLPQRLGLLQGRLRRRTGAPGEAQGNPTTTVDASTSRTASTTATRSRTASPLRSIVPHGLASVRPESQ